MKLNVIIDNSGNVTGAFQSGPTKLKDGPELRAGVVAEPNNIIHEIEVPDNLVTQPAARIQAEIQKIADKKFGLRPYLKENSAGKS
jgi:ABC-type branched-subunit amino acid transport system ATPase component